MALRHNHYDAAFEAYLRARRTAYVAVDEQRRALLDQLSLKSMDFIVYSRQAANLLVDVKGRQFPSGIGFDGDRRTAEDEQAPTRGSGHKWENWATADDIPSLLQWQRVFGDRFRAVLVFAYHIVQPRALADFDEVFEFRGRRYAFFGVWVDDYRTAMQTRSASWQTVGLPSQAFRELRSPIARFL